MPSLKPKCYTLQVQITGPHFNNISQSRSMLFSCVARLFEENVVISTLTKSNEARRENSQNPKGIGPIAGDDCVTPPWSTKEYAIVGFPCPARDWPLSRREDIVDMGSWFLEGRCCYV